MHAAGERAAGERARCTACGDDAVPLICVGVALLNGVALTGAHLTDVACTAVDATTLGSTARLGLHALLRRLPPSLPLSGLIVGRLAR